MNSYSDLTDEELVTFTLDGHEKAFEEIYFRYKGPLMNYYVSKTSDVIFAEDLLQKTFLKATLVLKQFDSKKPFKPWFFALAYHLMIDELRKRKSETSKHAKYQEHLKTIAPQGHDPIAINDEAQIQDDDKTAPVISGHASLPPKQQKALELRFIEELSYEEVALKLGVKPANARQIISRAIRKIKLSKRRV